MEIFVPERPADETIVLMHRLLAIGIGGRNAAYLASVKPPEQPGTPEAHMYLREFELMVGAGARAAAAALVGIDALYSGHAPEARAA